MGGRGTTGFEVVSRYKIKIDPCSKKGRLFNPFTAIYQACKTKFRVPRFINQMPYAVEYIMKFLFSCHSS